MNPWIGSLLALGAFVAGGVLYGWPGVLMALTVVVFWLLLQFNQVMRTLRAAAQGPVGVVASAVMLQAKLKPGMKLADVIMLTRSLGAKQPAPEGVERYQWTDAGGAWVAVDLTQGKVASWLFGRAETAEASSSPSVGPSTESP